jgi:phosphohistidine phosphatase
MDLILWRHAEAEDGFPDIERALTAKGIKQAAHVAKWLKPRLPEDTRVLASPAKRAQQTASALTAEFKTVKAIDTSSHAKAVLAAASWPEATGTVIVVGHQPTLGETAALVLSGSAQSWSLKKGALIWVAYRAEGSEDGGGHTYLRAALSPDLI